ncbi:hypothetical protein LTR56_013274 [Elasticomyces elasticus]|nr:hypothetical protein LTR56_013274 [Elasticomyces elasticus]KAK3668408.1 hypothetical protein LTR22_000700 [Elasticomyces elasticus]KAK4930902.1 hypothetical protein LTR49_002668 [Elasticomyces elasticus]KAK5758686.1 hypothetical protein LTS12_011232 [Elasticomyces elasticus]
MLTCEPSLGHVGTLSPFVLDNITDAFWPTPSEELVPHHLVTRVKSVQPVRKLRILALHGFTQSGKWFEIKMKPIEHHIRTTLPSHLLRQYPDGIEFLYPDGPVVLQDDGGDHCRAWFRRLDTVSRYEELDSSLEYLCAYVREHGPVDGVIGFSQGAAIAMMLASLCEASINPGRVGALRSQGSPIHLAPPQGPLKFVIACAGFCGTAAYYSGFYNPKIVTPSLHVIADLDTMVSAEHTSELMQACSNPQVVNHPAAHYLPRDGRNLNAIAEFIAESMPTTCVLPHPQGTNSSSTHDLHQAICYTCNFGVHEKLASRTTLKSPKVHWTAQDLAEDSLPSLTTSASSSVSGQADYVEARRPASMKFAFQRMKQIRRAPLRRAITR